MASPTIEAIIFDLDGTLIDSLEDISAAVNHALATSRRAPVSSADVRGWIGDGLPALCRQAAPDADEPTLSRIVDRARDYYSSHLVDHTTPYSNILPMLKLLHASGLPLGVLSNKPHELTVRIVERLGMSNWFRSVQGYTCEQEKKPHPAAALRILAQFAVAPRDAMLIGDSGIDLETAGRAGMFAGAVTWGFRDRPFLESARPRAIFDDPLEICRFVGIGA